MPSDNPRPAYPFSLLDVVVDTQPPTCPPLINAPAVLPPAQDTNCKGFSDMGDYWTGVAPNPTENSAGSCIYVRAPGF